MSHVTTDTDTDALEAAKQRLADLVRWRTLTVANLHLTIQTAEREIREINRQFDKDALELTRTIEALEPPPEPTRTSRPPKPINFDGMTEQEIAHFKELQERKANHGPSK